MKKNVSFWIVLLIIGSVVLCSIFLFKKSDEELIEERIYDFVDSFNNGDYEELLGHMSKSTRNTLKAEFNISDGLFSSITGIGGIGFADWFGAGVAHMSDGDMLAFNISDIEVNQDTATVIATMVFDMKYDFADSEDNAKISMVKEGRKWFIDEIEDYYSTSSDSSGSSLPNSDTNAVVIDPFKGIEYFVSGISPYCEISVNNQNCSVEAQEYVTYTFDKEKYKNGETAVITATLSRYADKEKYFLRTTTSKYIVNNQPEYVTSLDGLDLSMLEAELKDYIEATTARETGGDYMFSVSCGWRVNLQYNKVEQNDVYFSSLKNIRYDDFVLGRKPFNKISFIHLAECTHDYGEKKLWVNVFAENIIRYPDGTVKWGRSSSEGFDFNYLTSEKGLEDCITTTIMVDRNDYNISKVNP